MYTNAVFLGFLLFFSLSHKWNECVCVNECVKKVFTTEKLSLVGMDAKNCCNRQIVVGAVIDAKSFAFNGVLGRQFYLCFLDHLSRCEMIHIRGLLHLIRPSMLLQLEYLKEEKRNYSMHR